MDSIVIGSGFGGIAAALRLRAKGHNVTLIEKHKDLGGRARVFKKMVSHMMVDQLLSLLLTLLTNYLNYSKKIRKIT